MQALKSLLHVVYNDNTDRDLKAIYVNPEKQMAMAGYRRIYNLGDCLVRVFMNRPLDMGTLPYLAGTYHNDTKEYNIESPGLLGREVAGGTRELVDLELSDYHFSEVRNQIMSAPEAARFSVLLNPKKICEFIEGRTKHQGFEERKLNIEVFDGISAHNLFPGRGASFENGDPAIEITMPSLHHQGEFNKVLALVTEDSYIAPERIRNNKLYTVSFVKSIDNGFGVQPTVSVRVIGEFKMGIRMAIQTIPGGTQMPYDPRYSTYPDPVAKNNISDADVLEMPFIKGQEERGKFYYSPPLHIDLDTFYRAIKPMEMCRVVEFNYKDSITGFYMRTLEEVNGAQVEAIMGPTSPFKQGMVYTK
jgi:hypothetical protein